MKRLITILVVTLVIVSASMITNVHAFSESEESIIERMCKRAEEADKLTRSIIKWIKAD